MFARTSLLAAFTLTTLWPATIAIAWDSDGDGVDDSIDVCCNTPFGTPVDEEGRPVGDIDQDCDVDLEDCALLQASFTGPLPACTPCKNTGDCTVGEYCAKAVGDCDGDGLCQTRPDHEFCPRLWDPVCGCDANTYANANTPTNATADLRIRCGRRICHDFFRTGAGPDASKILNKIMC